MQGAETPRWSPKGKPVLALLSLDSRSPKDPHYPPQEPTGGTHADVGGPALAYESMCPNTSLKSDKSRNNSWAPETSTLPACKPPQQQAHTEDDTEERPTGHLPGCRVPPPAITGISNAARSSTRSASLLFQLPFRSGSVFHDCRCALTRCCCGPPADVFWSLYTRGPRPLIITDPSSLHPSRVG